MAEAFNKRDDVYGGTFIEGYCFHGDQRPLLVPRNWDRVIASYCVGRRSMIAVGELRNTIVVYNTINNILN